MENQKNIEKQIHFILFFFTEGESLQGIEDTLKLLNDCNKPVLFVINRATGDTDEDEKSKDIKATISHLKQHNYNKLIDEENFFGINLVRSKFTLDFGVEQIFKRIYKLLFEKKIITEDNNKINNTINGLCEDYSNIYEKPKEVQDIEKKNETAFQNSVNEVKKTLDKKYDLFKYIQIEHIKRTGIIASNRCKNFITSLANLSEVLGGFDESNLPAISYFQAFMVREIGEIFGFNFQEMEKEIDEYLQDKI